MKCNAARGPFSSRIFLPIVSAFSFITRSVAAKAARENEQRPHRIGNAICRLTSSLECRREVLLRERVNLHACPELMAPGRPKVLVAEAA